MKDKSGKQTALSGLIPTDNIVMDSPQRVMEIVREQIRILAPGGGFVLAPACEYPPNADLANAFAIARAAEIYGKYPIR